jgi:DNA mismatch repair protein MutS
VEDPKQAKGVVKREVVRVVSPGVALEEQMLDSKDNRYLAAISKKERWGLAFMDISTGEFLVAERDDSSAALEELTRMAPAEMLVSEQGSETELEDLSALLPTLCLTRRSASLFEPELARETLLDHFQVLNLAGFGCEEMTAGVCAAGALLAYIQETQKADLDHIEQLRVIELDDVLILDDSTRRNLELVQTIVGARRQGSLLATLDLTRTPMGARLLKRNLLFPLQDNNRLNKRLQTVDFLVGAGHARLEIGGDPSRPDPLQLCRELRDNLENVYDLERLNSRVVLGSANGRDLIALKTSLALLPRLRQLSLVTRGLLHERAENLDELTDILELLENTIQEEPPVSLREGRLIKPGYNSELDELVSIMTHGKQHILALEEQERQRSGIAKLKIGFNKVFGYFIEVSRAQQANVPENYIRKQTLVNAERFITPELKEFENKVLGAEEKQLELEYHLFVDIRNKVAGAGSRIIQAASFIAWIDYFTCLAEVARRYNYIRPKINDSGEIIIREGRHPVIERSLPAGRFVPNDIRLDQKKNEILIVTGPNMAGKSTVLRQTALIVLMAQMGSFVPAAEARIGVVDRIFTRVGAMDDLRRGQSTFMVEMNETANILHNATEKSLVVLDEIGRGTSTFDGLAIAWAVSEDLLTHNGKGVKTIFATHYHELTELAAIHPRIKNFNIAVREWNDSIIFLHKIMPGGASRSYGIQVAALAGVPKRVVDRAQEILRNIEKGEFTSQGLPRLAPEQGEQPAPLSLFSREDDLLRRKLAKIEVDRLTPLEALTLLYELKDLSETSCS